MCPTELPTVRDCLRYGLFLRETTADFNSNQSTMGFLQVVLEQIRIRWQRANAQFLPPVPIQDKPIMTKLTGLWKKCTKIAWNKSTAKDKDKFEEVVDKLFDITKCRCPFLSYEEAGVVCTGCHCDDPTCTGCPKYVTDLPP